MLNNFSIIIPNFNGEKYLENCLPSLLISLNQIEDKTKFEIILIDNGSIDNSIKVFKELLNKIDFQIIKNKNNHGFSPAINQGITASKYDWIVLLNNDLVIAKDWFLKVYHQIVNSNDNYAVFCGTILTKDGSKYESSGLNFNYRGKCQNINNGKKFVTRNLKSEIYQVWGCSAALAIYQKNILNQIGGFDNDFFAYEEDVDVCLRLYLLNYKTLLVSNAISYHLGGGTSNRMNNFRQIMDTKNWLYIIIKDFPINLIETNLFSIISERLRNLSGLIKSTVKIYRYKSFYYLPVALIKSYGEVLINLPKMLKKRRQFQNLLKSYYGKN